MTSHYAVVGLSTSKIYEIFDEQAAAFRWINKTFQAPKKRDIKGSMVVDMPEPLAVARLSTDEPTQLPYQGMDKRVHNISKRHDWERVHHVRAKMG